MLAGDCAGILRDAVPLTQGPAPHRDSCSLCTSASQLTYTSAQVNVLSYFETLCTDTGAANVLINSSLTILVVRMLRNARAPTLRVRLASALGLLIRHATYIADELATTGDRFSHVLMDAGIESYRLHAS